MEIEGDTPIHKVRVSVLLMHWMTYVTVRAIYAYMVIVPRYLMA